MFSIGFAMKLRPGKFEAYKDAHDNLWPEVAASMSDNQVSMTIHRYGDHLFLHATAPSQELWDRSRQNSRSKTCFGPSA